MPVINTILCEYLSRTLVKFMRSRKLMIIFYERET